MEESVPTTPAGNTIADEGDDPKDDSIILAQPATNPLVPTSNTSIKLLDVENPPAPDKEDGISTDALVA